MSRVLSSQQVHARFTKQVKSPLRPLNIVMGTLLAVVMIYGYLSLGF